MPFRSMEQGVAAIQQGKLEEGARLLRIALKSDELKGSMRAMAYLWLAETKSDHKEKVACYNDALAADPDNEHARQRIAQLLAEDLPPFPAQSSGYTPSAKNPPAAHTQPPTGAPAQQTPGGIFRAVGVLDGPNGSGTGFFVTRDGLLATTRFVVGGAETLTVALGPGQSLIADVVRSYSELDLAFLETGINVSQLLPFVTTATIPDNTPLTAIAYNGQVRSGQLRATRSIMKPQWFPTTIEELADAGGSPVFDDHNLLVGMLTRNAQRTAPYVFGLHISTILHQVDQFQQEMRLAANLVYCPSCGHRSRAQAAGGFYCETCGSMLPAARNTRRFPLPQMAALYGENAHRPCRLCGARVGYYDGRCLRCGQSPARSAP
jgi:hypothetical protein